MIDPVYVPNCRAGDADELTIDQRVARAAGPSAVAYVHSSGTWLDRKGAVQAIEALTALVEAHDVAEAEKARKLKAGDIVRARISGGWSGRRVVLTDEVNGKVDTVKVDSDDEFYAPSRYVGFIWRGVRAALYTRDEETS